MVALPSKVKLNPKHYRGLDPELVGEKAFEHPAVKQWWKWLLEEYTPEKKTVLISPCSNIKPYTMSPMVRKIRNALVEAGLWGRDNRPRLISWLHFTDLLVFVPHQRAEEYPACCYDVPPDLVLSKPHLLEKVVSIAARFIEKLADGKYRLVVFLPQKHMKMWRMVEEQAEKKPEMEYIKYRLYFKKEELVSKLEEGVKDSGEEGKGLERKWW